MKLFEISNREVIALLTKIATTFDSTNKNYLLSYPHFLNYFNNLTVIKLEHLIIGISFTYSWMPTILKSIRLENAEVTLSILNEVKNGKKINAEELTLLKYSCNNSLVGASKLLHFINPNQYAIWDSRVFRFLNKTEPYKYRLEKPATYLHYLDFIEQLKNEKTFAPFYQLMKQQVGYEITEYRALELAFFNGE